MNSATSAAMTAATSASPVSLPLSGYAARHVRLAVSGAVATVTLDRPERKNPLTFESYAELAGIFRAVARDKTVKSIVITGAGGNFCSGGDVFEIIKPLTEMNAAGLLDFTRMTGELVKAMRAAPQPIVAAVDGVCAGAGAIVAMASDIRIGTAGAKVAFLFNRVGLGGCDMGACAILPRIVGQGRAAELLFTGRSLGGEEAERWGFFNRLAAPDAVLAQAQALAAELAAGPTFGNAMTKRMLEMEWAMSVETAIEAEAVAQALCMETEDFARAFRAFADKRKPVFEGN
jgi:enoyl-CoA hydratase/carnithine racemase